VFGVAGRFRAATLEVSEEARRRPALARDWGEEAVAEGEEAVAEGEEAVAESGEAWAEGSVGKNYPADPELEAPDLPSGPTVALRG